MYKIKMTLLSFCMAVFYQISSNAYSQNTEKYWVFFKDKGFGSLEKSTPNLSILEKEITPRALKRRSKVLKPDRLFDDTDLPVCEEYINRLKKDGFILITESRWLNAVSVLVAPNQFTTLKAYSFVDRLQKVSRYERKPQPFVKERELVHPRFEPGNHQLDYGASFTQNALMHVPEVHDLGINGTGVIIGMLDTGFNYRQHSAFVHINVIDEYDFINQDNTTRNEAGEDSSYQDDHGTQTLATVGAFQQGSLIGPAYQADYLLAKTEYSNMENIIEEDYWVAGLEWLEKNGADIVSSSLGYTDWYTFEQMDGNTAITTRAADIAVKKGVVVINSMGNEGNKPGSIIAPADGDSVISVGAVTAENILSSFSSVGPTADQRVKPDVVAMGTWVHLVAPHSTGGFTYANGTSFACPLVSGVTALILSAHPELTPMQVRDALRETADQANNPNNEYGWGLVNALDAILYHGMVFSNRPSIQQGEARSKIIQIKILSKNGIHPDSVNIFFCVMPDSFVKYSLFQTGEAHEFGGEFALNHFGEFVAFYFSAVDSAGIRRLHPYDAPNTVFSTEGDVIQIPTSFHLYQNYPNPFNHWTIIQYNLLKPGKVKLRIYNVLGQLVKELIDTNQMAGIYKIVWDGRDRAGGFASSGVYIYEVQTDDIRKMKKMMLLRR